MDDEPTKPAAPIEAPDAETVYVAAHSSRAETLRLLKRRLDAELAKLNQPRRG